MHTVDYRSRRIVDRAVNRLGAGASSPPENDNSVDLVAESSSHRLGPGSHHMRQAHQLLPPIADIRAPPHGASTGAAWTVVVPGNFQPNNRRE